MKYLLILTVLLGTSLGHANVISKVSRDDTVVLKYGNNCEGESFPGDDYNRGLDDSIEGTTQKLARSTACESSIMGDAGVLEGIGTVGIINQDCNKYEVANIRAMQAIANDTLVKGTRVRILRYFSALITTFLPALYIAIINFHQGLLPTDLLFSIAGTREKVPFPSIIELLILEISFELIRESGIRMPGVIGPTLGIIGALILGQASVAANIVSPLLIIVVSITGIGSFAIADYSMSFACRLFLYIGWFDVRAVQSASKEDECGLP